MKKILCISIIALFVFLFAFFVSSPPTVYAEGEELTTTTAMVTEEPTTEITTIAEDELTEEEIQALIAQVMASLNATELVNRLWTALTTKAPWLMPILIFFGVGTPAALMFGVAKFVKLFKRRQGASAQLDSDINSNTEKQTENLTEIKSTKAQVAELTTIMKVVIPTVNLIAKGLNVLINASNNDAVAAQADGLTKDYQVATGDLSKVMKSTTIGQNILKHIGDVRDKLNL